MTATKSTLDRRSFLKVSTAAGGGIVLGFSWLASCTPDVLTEELELPEEWVEVNAYLKIGDNGVVTIMSQNPEIGQGVKTSMPMIVAEELDADWSKVIVEQAGLNTDNFDRQVAGGSQSIRQEWNRLRQAGATARHMILMAAAAEWNADISELTTDQGVVYHKSSGKSGHYGLFATAAASLEVPDPESITLKNPRDFRIIGTRVKNVDGKKIVTGEPLFGLDIQKEGMRIAMIEHPPAFGMKVKSIDDSAAMSMPGILDIFKMDLFEGGVEPSWSDTTAFPELVVIIGETTWQVMQAKKALNVEWEVDTPSEDSRMHNSMMDDLLAQSADEPSRLDGNPEDAFAIADRIIERTYSAPFLAHNPMEPMNFYANVTEDRAELEGPIQTPKALRETTAKVLKMDEDKISIMMTRMGGGFGRRLYGHFGLEAAKISQMINAPVQLVYTREDDMTDGIYRPAYKTLYRAAIDKDNNVTAIHLRNTGIEGNAFYPNRFPAGAIDHFLAERTRQSSNISTGAWRAPGSNFASFAEQAFIDELAEETGQDPIEMRLKWFKRAQDNPMGTYIAYDPTGQEWDRDRYDYNPERYAGVLELVKEKSGWGKETPGIYKGVSAYYCHNSYIAQVAEVSMKNGKPKLEKIWCAVDCGIVVNKEGALSQVEGSIVDGIGHAMYSAITFSNGRPEQSNFNNYRMMRNSEAPESIEVFFVDNGISPTGLGEPGLPPIMAAVANALYKATGKRLYSQPFAEDKALLG